jgi:hypothetical protein
MIFQIATVTAARKSEERYPRRTNPRRLSAGNEWGREERCF